MRPKVAREPRVPAEELAARSHGLRTEMRIKP